MEKESSTPWQIEWVKVDEVFSGGQGSVTKLHGIKNPKKLAVLKEILSRWKDNQEARERLRQEAETLSKLHQLGARVPKVYDSFINYESSDPFLLMEFIPGIRFDKWLADFAPVSPSKAELITKAVAETIKLCHEHNIGHRDLKPSNIILKDEKLSEPYILDFGISFDSQQTKMLTRDGEMFWNEFIILPECQDLEGGHRDPRSDITALVGVFFSCLTGRSPIVLRDANERAPHQRHEQLIYDSCDTTDQAERMMWFFDKGFAFRISDRFQSLDEFDSEISLLVHIQSDSNLDVLQEFEILNQTVKLTDRNVQLASLRTKYSNIHNKINEAMVQELSVLRSKNGVISLPKFPLSNIPNESIPSIDNADNLAPNVQAYLISREHYPGAAIVLLTVFAVGMDLHLFSASYISQTNNATPITKQLNWTRIAIIKENQTDLDENKQQVIVDALKNKLAHEVRNLIRM